MAVLFETSVGNFVLDLDVDRAPKSAIENLLRLCELKYLNNTLFFSVESGFVAQGGDPTGTGRGGDCWYGVCGEEVPSEERVGRGGGLLAARPARGVKHLRAAQFGLSGVSTEEAGVYGHSSLFYITLGGPLPSLDGRNTILGDIVEGDAVLDRLNGVTVDSWNRPLEDIRVRHTYILDYPSWMAPGSATLRESPQEAVPSAETVPPRLIVAEEGGEDNRDATVLEEAAAEAEAHSRRVILEMVGDRPSAEAMAPESVLFLANLNPVTSASDLATVCERFGRVIRVSLAKHPTLGTSRGYGWVEFESKDVCEEAYLKLDGCWIDDRKIRVDFSQSVKRHPKPQTTTQGPAPPTIRLKTRGGYGVGGMAGDAVRALSSQLQSHQDPDRM